MNCNIECFMLIKCHMVRIFIIVFVVNNIIHKRIDMEVNYIGHVYGLITIFSDEHILKQES